MSCPGLAVEGSVFDAASAYGPPPCRVLDLAHLGPMTLCRLWSAVHDALMYNNPQQVTGEQLT